MRFCGDGVEATTIEPPVDVCQGQPKSQCRILRADLVIRRAFA
jgi:hypothetical protein